MPRNSSCTLCPLHTKANSVCVWGRQVGVPIAGGVLILGEGPGWQEDMEARPFIGRSGELLAEAMKAVGIRSYYLTNTTKCFPGKKAKPGKKDVAACAAYLDEEFEQIKPKYVLAFGNYAVQRMIGRGKVTEIAGKEIWSDKYNCWVFPEVHPAYILRAEGKKGSWMMDLHRFANLIAGELHEEPPVDVQTVEYAAELPLVLEEIVEHAQAGKPFTYDVEATYGLDWWHRDYQLYTISFGLSEEKAICIPLAHPQSPFKEHIPYIFSRLRRAFEADCPRIAHNCMYDDLAIYRFAGYFPNCTWDTMAAWHVLDENSPKGLKWLARAVLGWPDYGIDTKDLAKDPLDKVAFYNGCDTVATWNLYQRELAMFHDKGYSEDREEQLRYFQTVPMPAAQQLVKVVANGVHIDRATLKERAVIASKLAAKARKDIPVENPGSYPQLRKWLYEDEKLPIVKTTDTGAASTDEETIKRLALQFPQAMKVLEWRKPMKNISTYFIPDLHKITNSIDERAHYDYKHASVETGRLGSGYHTRPRDPFVRNVVSAREGWTFVEIDAAQIEARLAAWSAINKPATWDGVPDWSMLAAFGQGRDVYKETAAGILGKRVDQISSEERQVLGKVPTLASLYEISAKGLREYAWTEWEIAWSIEEATEIWQGFRARWREFPLWHEREGIVIKSRGWAKSAIGRWRRIPEARGDDKYVAEAAVRSGINMPIQSLANDLILTALILLNPKLDPSRILIVGVVHDALHFEVRNDKLEKFVPAALRIMERAYLHLEPLGLQLPEGLIKMEAKIGPWGGKWSGKELEKIA
jgi:DNA polymerase-1